MNQTKKGRAKKRQTRFGEENQEKWFWLLMLLQQKNQRSSTKAPTGGAGLLEVRAQQSESFHDAETQVESAAATVFHLATKDLQPPSHCAHTEADAIPLDQTEGGCQLSQKPIFVPHHFGPQVNV